VSSAGGIPPPLPGEDTMPKLTDTQLIILAAAAKRDDALGATTTPASRSST